MLIVQVLKLKRQKFFVAKLYPKERYYSLIPFASYSWNDCGHDSWFHFLLKLKFKIKIRTNHVSIFFKTLVIKISVWQSTFLMVYEIGVDVSGKILLTSFVTSFKKSRHWTRITILNIAIKKKVRERERKKTNIKYLFELMQND